MQLFVKISAQYFNFGSFRSIYIELVKSGVMNRIHKNLFNCILLKLVNQYQKTKHIMP